MKRLKKVTKKYIKNIYFQINSNEFKSKYSFRASPLRSYRTTAYKSITVFQDQALDSKKSFSRVFTHSLGLRLEKYNISDGWLSGFIQSDGCFTITFEKRKSGLNIRPKPIFVITQDISEENLFKSIHKYLGAGYLTKNRGCVNLYITSLDQLKTKLFPILDRHKLKYGKLDCYLTFKSIVEAMLNKTHLNLQGLLAIIYTGFALNSDTTTRSEVNKNNLLLFLQNKYGVLPNKEEVSHLIKSWAPPLKPCTQLSLEFIAGLIDGDGSFNVSFQIKPYRRVRVNFTIVQEKRSVLLLHDLKTFFSCGEVYKLPCAAFRLQVENIDLILDKIKPVLQKTSLNTYKRVYFNIAINVCEIIKRHGFKNNVYFKQIVELAYISNKTGKRRSKTKEEILNSIREDVQ